LPLTNGRCVSCGAKIAPVTVLVRAALSALAACQTRIGHRGSRPGARHASHCPQQNSMVERLVRMLKEQCAHRHRFETKQHASRVIGDWIAFYNHRRPHQALGMKTTPRGLCFSGLICAGSAGSLHTFQAGRPIACDQDCCNASMSRPFCVLHTSWAASDLSGLRAQA